MDNLGSLVGHSRQIRFVSGLTGPLTGLSGHGSGLSGPMTGQILARPTAAREPRLHQLHFIGAVSPEE